MKPKTTIKSSSIAILALAFAGISLAPSAFASDQQAFAKAGGKYTGTLSGGAATAGVSIPATATTIKMPKGKGKGKISITGFPSIKGKVTKAVCRQGGKKVIQSGVGKVPASVTGGVLPGAGAITVPFKSVITLGSGPPKMKAKVSVEILGFSLKAKFTGSK